MIRIRSDHQHDIMRHMGMKMMHVVVTLSLLALSGCGGGKASPPSFSPVAERYHTALQKRADLVDSLQGELAVEVWEKQKRVAVRQLFAAQPPHHMRMDTLTPFDQPLVTVIFNDQLLAVHDRENARFSVGEASSENFAKLTKVKMTPSEMSALLTGQVPRIMTSGGEVKWDAQRGKAVLTLMRENDRQVIYFDEKTLTPRLMELYQAGQLTLRILLAQYTSGEPRLPQRLRVELPRQSIRVELKLKDYRLNPSIPDRAFKVEPPPGLGVSEL